MISIITPAYNAGNYIAETIESVLAQTYQNWELIIVDDGSTDNTADIVKSYLTDARIQYFYQKNGKQGKARNLAISHSKGTYLAFLDADDLWIPKKMQLQMQVIQTHNVDVVFSQGWLFSENINSKLKDFNAPIGLQV
ncbi:MAG: glycosyltransferase family 2 protein [Bacteroidetes bacterium]|nr:glycosyltransferase family 2 protein [Bacteroidota bacterium]